MKSRVQNVLVDEDSSVFERLLSNGACEASVAVIERGARWPHWLDAYLTGRQDVLVLAQLPNETREQLALRLAVKAGALSSPVRQLVWIAQDGAAPGRIAEALSKTGVRPGTPNGTIVAVGDTLTHYVETSQGQLLLALSPSLAGELNLHVA